MSFITLKNIRDRHPAPRESMPVWAGAVYSYRQPTSDRKDNIKISNHQILHKEAVPLCVNLHKKVTKVTKVTGNSTPYYPSPQLLIIYNYIRVYIIYIYIVDFLCGDKSDKSNLVTFVTFVTFSLDKNNMVYLKNPYDLC